MRRGSEGSVLVYVVWIVLLLSVFAAGVGSQAHAALELSDRLLAQLRARYIARGAVHYAARLLALDPSPSADNLSEPWADAPAMFGQHPLVSGGFIVTGQPQEGSAARGVLDEDRRMNLNVAPVEVLARLVEQAGGVPRDEARQIADAIEDWRDADSDERSFGAEDYYYRSLPEAYDCKDGPFENAEELRLIRGVSSQLYRRLEPYVTVYGSGRINLNTAERPVLEALGLSADGVSGLLAYRSGEDSAADSGDERRLIGVTVLLDELASYVPAEDLHELSLLASAGVIGTASEAIRLMIETQDELDPASRVRLTSVIDRKGHVQLWEER